MADMGQFLLGAAHTVLALALCAMALACVRGHTGPWVRRAVVALAFLPFLALNGLIASKMLLLRFEHGIEHAPWLWAVALFLAHLIGAAVLRSTALRATWGPARTGLVALVALTAGATTLHVMALDLRFLGMQLQLEAGQTAYTLTPPRPAEEENAAPLYEALEADLVVLRNEEEGAAWREALARDEPIDGASTELDAYLARVSGVIDRIRAATTLPRCVFAIPGEVHEVQVPAVTLFVPACDLLCLSARARTADGDLAGACADLTSIFALADHVVETPSLVAVLTAAALRMRAFDEVERVLSMPALTLAELGALVVPVEPLVPQLQDALQMDEAYTLSILGRAIAPDGLLELSEGFGDTLPLFDDLFMLLCGRAEVRALRAGIAEQRARAAAAQEPSAADPAPRGLVARLAIVQMGQRIAWLRQCDARGELTRAAVAATRTKLEHGAYPREVGPWCGPDAPMEVSGDGDSIVLTHSGSFPEPLVLRLPARHR